ncbi:MAG: IPT/TIG domain-containing protein, partial [Thermoguttaceae bacterium]
MGIRMFHGFRPFSKRGSSRCKGNKGSSHYRRVRIEQCENRLLLSSVPVLTSVNPMTGPTIGGTQVTIVGTNLAGATSVKFGNPAATIVSDTATQIVANSPAEAAGAVDITVTTSAGTSALSAVDKFTYVAAPPTGPQLSGIIPNTGSVLTAGEVLNVAPTQLTLQFNQNEQIDPTTLSGITITYTNAAGVVSNAPIGYLAVNDAPNLNQVIVRFSQTLLSGTYSVNIEGAGATPLTGTLVDPTTGTTGQDLPFNGGQNYSLSFTLDLGSMVSAVVPQPVTRTATGQLQQAVNEIDVYFTDKLSAVSAQNPQFYQLIDTDNTANTNDQSIYNPTSVVYNSATNEASLYFFQSKPYYADPNNLSAVDRAHDLNSLAPNGTQAMRLRIGDSYQQISTTTLSPAPGAAGTTYADAYAVPSFSTAAQSYVISNEIETTAYDLQLPGGASDPGNRKMVDEPEVDGVGGVLIEGGFWNGVGGSFESIPTITYNFPAIYGNDAQGNPDHNQITPQQELDTEEIFQLFSAYFGAQFEQSTSTALGGANIGVVTGDLYPMGFTSGQGTLGVGGTEPNTTDNLAVMDAAQNWGTSAFGGSWMLEAMATIMYNLGFGHSDDLPPDQVQGDDVTQGTSELVLPGIGDLTTALNLFRADSGDINMYKVTLTTPGTLSAETIAQRLPDPSLLNTELRVFQQNADGSYSAIAQNDDYFSTDSYVSLTLQPGTYFVGVSASGNNSYDPSIPNSGMNGTTTGPYELRVDFTPQETLGPAQASASGNIVLTGSNLTVNTGTTPFTQIPGGDQVTIKQIDPVDVPSVAALSGETFTVTQGSASYTFQFVDTSNASNQAAAGNIAIDFNSTTDTIDTIRADMVTAINDVFTVLVGATGVPLDGDADGTPGGLYNYWFNVAGEETSGANDRTIFVDKSAPSGGTGGIATPYTTISAALAAAASDAKLGLHDIVRIEGNNTGNLSADQSYNIGTDILGNVLSDGSTMVVPRNTTVMIDAGAVFKLRGANIQVGSSSANVDLSGASLQVLGTPLDSVYFTSWQDSSIGKTINPIKNAPRAGDWGGIVFRNDADLAYNDSTPPPAVPRPDPEANGIFLDYVNHADLLYGGGVVSTNSVPATYDPIYMDEARPTISYNVIEHSADAAMSADPNSFQVSLFEGDNSATGYYTADYERSGPSLNANLLLNNAINGMLVRIRTNAGEPIDTVTTTAQFNARDITYVVPENLEIAGNPGGPIVSAGNTTSLLQANPQQIQAVSGSSINDGSTFTITNSANSTGVVFEFDGVSFSVLSGSSFNDGDLLTIADPANPSTDQTFEFETAEQAVTNPSYVKITFDPGDTPGQMEAAIATAINNATGLDAIPLPYGGATIGSEAVPGTVALENFTTTQTFTFIPAGTTTGLTVVGTPGVAAGHQRVVFDASQSPDEVALEIRAAIIASGLEPAGSVTVQGSLVTIPNASIAGLTESTARLHGSLVIDPGVVVKLSGSRIEAELGATFIAEGTANNPVVFTSVEDDRYGSGGTFDLTGDGYDTTSANTPQPGDWSGILADPVSQVSIDHAVIAYAGGFSSIEGGFAAFNAIETRQGQLRVANSLLEYNADGAAAGTDPDRNGRGYNGPATIWVLGAQPVIVDNTFLNNDLDRGGTTSDGAAVISIDVNSLNSDLINDWGRATGPLDAFTQYNGNFGPLVRGNILQNNGLNGMLVRSGVLSTQSVWDDTDIVYIVEGDISVPNLHTYGGLRLQSSDDASLVVKLLTVDTTDPAGFTAAGRTLDTTDRVGGEVQIIGQPGFPVILTSLNDNTVGAGFDLSGNPQDDTINNPNAVAAAGDWNSVLIEQYSNDTNVQVV